MLDLIWKLRRLYVIYREATVCTLMIDQCGILVSRLTLVDAYSICGSKCNFSCAVSTFRLEDIVWLSSFGEY